jgi:hypothetical protein
MADLAKLQADLAALKSARRSGVLRTRFGDREVQYRSDAEMAAQVAALESEINALDGSPAVRSIAIRSKGWS